MTASRLVPPVDPLVLRPHVPDDQPGVLDPAAAPAVVQEVPVLVPGVVAVMLPPPLHPDTNNTETTFNFQPDISY